MYFPDSFRFINRVLEKMITLLSLKALGLDRTSSFLDIKEAFESNCNYFLDRFEHTPKSLHNQIRFRLSICCEAFSILRSTFSVGVQKYSISNNSNGDVILPPTPLTFQVSFFVLFIFLGLHMFRGGSLFGFI